MLVRLSLLLAAVGIAVGGCAPSVDTAVDHPATLPSPQKPYANVSPSHFQILAARPDTVILDVRSPAEFDGGHLAGAINIDFNAADFSDRVASLDKGKTYLVQCRSGARSSRACGEMSEKGFTRLYNLEGGINACISTGKPILK